VTAATAVDTKTCAGCKTPFERPRDTSNARWDIRKYCGISCANGNGADTRPVDEVRGDTTWQTRAACLGAEPAQFDALDFRTPETDTEATDTARVWCSRCPVLVECGAFADANRHIGIWAGAQRRVTHGAYTRIPLIEGAPLGELPDRRAGRYGWTK
jgi:hypothetical protein